MPWSSDFNNIQTFETNIEFVNQVTAAEARPLISYQIFNMYWHNSHNSESKFSYLRPGYEWMGRITISALCVEFAVIK